MGSLLRLCAAISLFGLICGCASGYKTNYQSLGTPGIDVIPTAKSGESPRVEHTPAASSGEVLATYYKKGYVGIGYSAFTSAQVESDTSALAQAKDVGADLVVIFTPRYAGSTSLALPTTTPTTTTSTTTGTATAYGSGGSATAFGTATTTTYGQNTSYIPVTMSFTSYAAIYFVKVRFTFGAYFRELTDSERKTLQSNHGAVVDFVADDSPAFSADVLSGDIITAVDGAQFQNIRSLLETFQTRRGQRVALTIVRGSQVLTKDVALSP